MNVIYDLFWAPDFNGGSIVTIGEFDGFHVDQRDIITETVRAGNKAGSPTIVVTFDVNLPRSEADGYTTDGVLTTLEQKLSLFAAAGVDYTVVLPTDEIASHGGVDLTAGSQADSDRSQLVDWIINDVVVKALQADILVVGATFDTAIWGQTDLEELTKRGESGEFKVIEVAAARPSVKHGVVSAGAIRQALNEGDVESAHEMLGRPYEIRSTVVRGEQRGRHLGFPTANLPLPPEIQIPGDGVYACWYFREDGTRFKAAVNVGKRPTFYPDNDQSLIEAHLIDYRGDLYAESARLVFVNRIRAERRFEGVDELSAQLQTDIATAVALLE